MVRQYVITVVRGPASIEFKVNTISLYSAVHIARLMYPVERFVGYRVY